MSIVSIHLDKLDEDGEVPVTLKFYMCCPEHAAKVISAILATLNETIGETVAAIMVHNSIKQEFNTTLQESMTRMEDPAESKLNHNLNKDLN